MAKSYRLGAALALLSMGTSLAAQSAITPGMAGPPDNRVRAGIVVPFGSAGRAAERAPRFEAWSEQSRTGIAAGLPLANDRLPALQPRTRIGVTLSSQPSLMINGREVPAKGDRKGISSLGWVGIGVGVGVAVIVFGVAALDAFNKDNGGNGIF